MDYVIIGSDAMRSHYPEFRDSVDVDIICSFDCFKEVVKGFKDDGVLQSCVPISGNKYVAKFIDTKNRLKIAEFEIAWGDNTSTDMILEKYKDIEVATPELLYVLKMSHRYKKNSPHFKKTMDDIQFLRSKGITSIPEELKDIYNKRVEETYDYSHPSLNQSKKDFFTDDVDYVYDHDTIHLAVATLVNAKGEIQPAYNFIKPDNKEVYCSKDMFEAQPYSIKLLTVVEESMVLAIERSLVPFPNSKTPEEAFEYALMKVCTSISSGWWREFAWENYQQALNYFYDKRDSGWKYEEAFQRGVENGTVKKFNKEND